MKAAYRLRKALGGLALHTVLLAGAVIMVVPFIWMISSSLKESSQVFALPPQWIPDPVVWDNYLSVWQAVPLAQYYKNSLIICGLTTAGQLVTSILAAYVFARLEFPGKDITLHLHPGHHDDPRAGEDDPVVHCGCGSWAGLTPSPASSCRPWFTPLGIFMLRQFFLSIPKELEDAARIDGSSRLGILWRIILPVSKAPISALAVFVFMFQWNAFLWPLIVLNSQENYTLQIGLAMLRGDVGTDYALQMAATAVATLPLVSLLLIAQKQFIRGITLTGLKY